MHSNHNISLETKKAKIKEQIVFSNENLEVKTYHNDVVVTIIANFEVHNIMIDSGSIADILFYETFFRMKHLEEKLLLL